MISFSEWLKIQEVSTSTADVANFSRPIFGGMVTRQFAPLWGEEDPFFRKKKKKVKNDEQI